MISLKYMILMFPNMLDLVHAASHNKQSVGQLCLCLLNTSVLQGALEPTTTSC